MDKSKIITLPDGKLIASFKVFEEGDEDGKQYEDSASDAKDNARYGIQNTPTPYVKTPVNDKKMGEFGKFYLCVDGFGGRWLVKIPGK